MSWDFIPFISVVLAVIIFALSMGAVGPGVATFVRDRLSRAKDAILGIFRSDN